MAQAQPKKQEYVVLMFSPATMVNTLLVDAVDEQDAERQGWRHIRIHGFKMWVTGAKLASVYRAEQVAKYGDPFRPRRQDRSLLDF